MATIAKEPKAQTTVKPIKVFRLRGVTASVFANQATSDGRDITFHKVSIQRVFKDGAEWRTTTNFGRDELPIAQLLMNRAWEFILDAEATPTTDAGTAE